MPGIFGDATIRLLRENWPNATMLAQELFTILGTSQSQNLQGPINVTNATGQPAMTLTQLGNAPGLALEFPNSPDGPTPPFPFTPNSASQPSSGGGSGAIIEVQITVIAGDLLTVTSTVAGIFTSDTVQVAKPVLLRQSVGLLGRDGETYDYSMDDGTGQYRVATFGTPTGTENQQVVPLYEVGDTIYITQLSNNVAKVTPTTAYLDLNVDARAWASVIPPNPPAS